MRAPPRDRTRRGPVLGARQADRGARHRPRAERRAPATAGRSGPRAAVGRRAARDRHRAAHRHHQGDGTSLALLRRRQPLRFAPAAEARRLIPAPAAPSRGKRRQRMKEGRRAPAFRLPDQDGNLVSAVRLRGADRGPLLLSQGGHARLHDAGVRHPRPPAPTTTRPARWSSASRPTTGEGCNKFARQARPAFTLLADADHAVAEQYGVWVEKSMYGRTYWGVAARDVRHRPDGKSSAVVPEGLARRARRRWSWRRSATLAAA